MLIEPSVKAELLDLMQREAQAKAALTEAITEVADRLELDKAVLKKVIAAAFKDQTWKLRHTAAQTLDLLEPPHGEAAPARSTPYSRAMHDEIDQARGPH